METSQLKKFAQFARRSLIEQVSAKLKLVLSENSAARRERADAVKKLDEQIKLHGQEHIIERVAYTWFNRFCALRFMDVNHYTRIGVVSPAEGQSQPEILAEAKMGFIDDGMVPEKIRQQIFALLDGTSPSQDPQSEAYRLLVVAICNYWYKAMPFLFERIDDYTELLMPDDLLSGNSILASTRDAMTPDTCEDVEVIGWLYQFYIAEKKDEVFAGLKKNNKITPENIPAATQLFTPHWIVRYLVENSLGRLWMQNRPNSKLIQQMDYYIKPEQPETDFLRITKPEELKICDPACGSGHMLTYAFDLLYSIYEEEGYEPSEIPEKVLTHNLYGIEIDERARELAAFALTMKARSKQRRFFRKKIQPNICVLENVQFEDDELDEYMDFIGRDLFTTPLQITLRQFEEADNFGSLIRPDVTDVAGVLQLLKAKDVSGQLFLSETHKKVLQTLQHAGYLSPKYHIVIANPPYMGANQMALALKNFIRTNYKEGSANFFGAFILRGLSLAKSGGFLAMIALSNWLFLTDYRKLRQDVLKQASFTGLIDNGRGVWGSDFESCSFILQPGYKGGAYGTFRRLFNTEREVQSNDQLVTNYFDYENYPSHTASNEDFESISGSPIAFWLDNKVYNLFRESKPLRDVVDLRVGLQTGENDRFLRFWQEVNFKSISFSGRSEKRWYPYSKGGEFRKWYGNTIYVVNWKNDGEEIRSFKDKNGVAKSYPRNMHSYFKEGVEWSDVGQRVIGARYRPDYCIFDVVSMSGFEKQGSDIKLSDVIGYLNSSVSGRLMNVVAPGMHYNTGYVGKLPYKTEFSSSKLRSLVLRAIEISKNDWNSFEVSFDFTTSPLFKLAQDNLGLQDVYNLLRMKWNSDVNNLAAIEIDNNMDYIKNYGLNENRSFEAEIPLSDITINCNPSYRYNRKKSHDELELLLLSDTAREFISYAVGCMFGRYALDKPGLILANQDETIEDYLKQIPEPSFPADDDNVIPILDGDWFTDDITERFLKFLRITFGKERYEENLHFIETAIGKNIRNYFLKHFYNDHVKRYKKRPIYWLFSSPKGSFNALIYMHRYRPDSVSVVLNDYLREFGTKLTSRKNQLEALSISASANKSEKTRALKEIEKINKMIDELDEYEREVLYPLATEQVEIELDDGVKVNYNKFGKALKKIPGLTAKGN